VHQPLEKRLRERAVELGKSGDPSDLAELIELTCSPAASVRKLAASAVGKLAGLANARRKGIRLGRPSILAKVSPKIHLLKEKGLSNRAIARKLKVGEATVRRALN